MDSLPPFLAAFFPIRALSNVNKIMLLVCQSVLKMFFCLLENFFH